METTGVFADMMRLWIGWAAFGIELLAVAVILAAVVIMTVSGRTVRHLFKRPDQSGYERYKHSLGKALLLALELLVAADVARTVTLAPTMENVSVLGILVLVRTILSWSLIVEMEGRWPWQAGAAADAAAEGMEKRD